jgi:hypothetical protein
MKNFTIYRNGEYSKTDNIKLKLSNAYDAIVSDTVSTLTKIDQYFVTHEWN